MKHLTIVITIIVLTTMFSGCNYSQDNIDDVVINEKIIQSTSFNVNSDSTELETSARGAVFLSGIEGVPEHVQIVALIEIDPEDWGGVSFYIPNNWHISNITSSYLQDENGITPENHVAIWTTADKDHEWSAMIEVGTDRVSYAPTGGGKGTVVIDLDNKEISSASDVFKILVGVGSKEKDGIKSMNPDYEIIEISIP